MQGTVIVYGMADGSVQTCRPQIGAKLVASLSFGSKSETFDPPVPAYRALRPFQRAIASRAFTEANLTWGESEGEFLARVNAKSSPADAVSSTIMQSTDTPRRKALFFEAWRLNGAKVDVDMPKARVIKTDLVRVERDKRIAQAAIDHQNADIDGDGDGAAKAAAAQRIRALRDLPATIQPDLDAITSPEALEAYEPPWPE